MNNNEFKKSKNGQYTVYTLESATGGSTSAGNVGSVSKPMGGVHRRGDNLITQEGNKDRVDASKPRNFVAKNAKMGGAGAHKDKKKEQKQGNEKHKKPYMEDHEVSMASNELKSIHSDAQKLLGLVQQYGENGDLQAWQQSKITKAADYLNSVLQSIGGEQDATEGMDRRDFMKSLGAIAGAGGVMAATRGISQMANTDKTSPKMTTFNGGKKAYLHNIPIGARGRLTGEESLGRFKLVTDDRGQKIYVWSAGDAGSKSNNYAASYEYRYFPVDQLKNQGMDEGVAEGIGGDMAKLIGIPVVAGAAAIGAQYYDDQQPHVQVGGQNAKIVRADSNRIPDNAMILTGKDGKQYRVWQRSGKGMSKMTFAAPVEGVKEGVAEGYNDISVGDYVSYDDGPGTDRWEVVSIEGNRVELRNDQGGTTFADINDVLKEQGVAEGLNKRDQQDVAAIRAAIARLESQLNHPNADKAAIQQSIAHEKKRLALYGVTEAAYNPDTFVGKKGTYKGYGITQEGPYQWGISSSVRKFPTLDAAKRHIDKNLVAEGSIGDKIKGAAKSVKRVSQGWGAGGESDAVSPKDVVQAFGKMDGQRLANFVASRKDLSKPRNNSARAFADKVIDREMRQRGYGRVAGKDEQGVAEGQTPEQEIERLKLRQNAEHGKAPLRRQAATQARIRELEKQIKDDQGVSEGPELKKAKREYNQAAKDAGGDWAGAGKKIDNMKKGLRQKDVGKDKSVAETDGYMEGLMQKLAEKIPASAPVDVWVQDFQKADPNKYHQFKNKTPAKKAQMAVAASYAAKNPDKKK